MILLVFDDGARSCWGLSLVSFPSVVEFKVVLENLIKWIIRNIKQGLNIILWCYKFIIYVNVAESHIIYSYISIQYSILIWVMREVKGYPIPSTQRHWYPRSQWDTCFRRVGWTGVVIKKLNKKKNKNQRTSLYWK